jgi:hypothetical protein
MAGPDPAGLDVTTPNIACMYDHMLDGKDNFAADRDAAGKLIAMMPQLPLVARAAAQALRSLESVRRLFDGFELVEPGLVWVSEWRPGPAEAVEGVGETLRGGVARKAA